MRAGDRAAAETFAGRHVRWVVDYARRQGAGDLAEDVAQIVISNLIERPFVELKRATAAPYLRRCIASQISLLKKRTPPHDTHRSHIDPATTPSAAVARRHAVEKIAAAVGGMSEKKQELFRLRYREDLNAAEIAIETGHSAGTVRRELARIRESIRGKIFFL